MRHRAHAALAVLLLVAGSAAGQDFRKVTWGMSPAEVIAAEKGLQLSEMKGTARSILTSRVDVMGFTGILNYFFEAGRLVSAQYKFDDEADMRTYNEISAGLAEKYGPPADSGDAYSLWTSARTIIRLSFKDNLSRVDYADKAWVSAMREKRRAEYDSLF